MKAIIFDFDGVIHDTFELYYKIHKHFNSNSSRENYRSYFEGKAISPKGKDKSNDENKKEFIKFRELELEAFKDLNLEKEIKRELEKLDKDFDLYIISSNSINNLKIYFENSKFTHIFKDILGYETHKSKIEKFKILFEKYNLDKDSCVFVTDTLGDILEANKVGVKTIACTFGFHDEARLKKGNPFKIVRKFEDIGKVVKKI